MWKRVGEEAEPMANLEYQRDPDAVWKFVYQILVKALRGKHEEAQAVPEILKRSADTVAITTTLTTSRESMRSGANNELSNGCV